MAKYAYPAIFTPEEKGYSIEEKLENGKIQLKLIKRIY